MAQIVTRGRRRRGLFEVSAGRCGARRNAAFSRFLDGLFATIDVCDHRESRRLDTSMRLTKGLV